MNQSRNLMITMVLCLVILAGWFWLENQIWPRKPKGKDAKAPAVAKVWVKLTNDQKKEAVQASLVASFAPLSGHDAFRRIAEFAATFDRSMPLMITPPPPPLRFETLTEEQKHRLAGAAIAGLVPFNPFVAAAAGRAWSPPATVQAEEVVLGGKEHFIQARFTTKGAGMVKLELTQFRSSDYLGHRTDKLLELVQEDHQMPSFLMYHFEKDASDPTKLAERPVLTLGTHIWKLESQSPERVVFSTRVPDPDFQHVTIVKTYTLAKREYHIGLSIEIKDSRPAGQKTALPFRYQLAGAHGVPIEGEWYTSIFRNAVIGTVDSRGGLWRDLKDAARLSYKAGGDRVPEGDRGDHFIQYAGVMNQYFASLIIVDNKQESGVDMKNILAWARATVETTETRGRIAAIAGNVLHLQADKRSFFLLNRAQEAVADRKLKTGDLVVISHYETKPGQPIATWVRPGTELHPFSDDIAVRVHSEPIELRPGERTTHKFMLYHGPVKTMLLGQFGGEKAVDPDLVERYTHTLHLDTLTDYRSEGFFGAFAQTIRLTDLLIFVTKLMHWLLNVLHWIVPSYALTIILLTVIVRGAMFPISRKQAQMSIKMQELAPEMKKIQEKFKNDPRGKNEAVMELYRKNRVNPLGMCLPLVLQLPVFLGLYYCLQESIHFRLAGGGFLFWIDNLAAPDMLVWWGEGIPWLSDPDSQGGVFYLGPYLNLLPIFAVALMIVQQKLMTPPPTDEQQAMTQKMMKYMMVFFGIMFYKVAAGLCIYFIASSLWGLAERKLLPNKPTTQPQAPPQFSPTKPRGQQGGMRSKPKAPTANGDGSLLQKLKSWWEDLLERASKK